MNKKINNKMLSIILIMLVTTLNLPICNALLQTDDFKITEQGGPPYTVTVRKFIGGFVANITFGYKSMSFDAIKVCIISRKYFRGFENEWYCNGESIYLKQTNFKGVMTNSILFGISIYTYSIHG
ncbi:MAG: hypothetical protein KAU84_02860 [Thermoplasmatales archaeon]|nr:hypothetical protein [Thermoplasmatales archaeon]